MIRILSTTLIFILLGSLPCLAEKSGNARSLGTSPSTPTFPSVTINCISGYETFEAVAQSEPHNNQEGILVINEHYQDVMGLASLSILVNFRVNSSDKFAVCTGQMSTHDMDGNIGSGGVGFPMSNCYTIDENYSSFYMYVASNSGLRYCNVIF